LLSEPNFDDPGRERGGVALLCSSVVADVCVVVWVGVLFFCRC
jgi:hypothetical protein